MINNKKFGLSLSGGGYRAMVYHLGTFKKLKELNLLDKVDVISSNSGGSITGATYALHLKNYNEFEKIILHGAKRSVIKFTLTSLRILIPTILFFGLIIGSIWLLFRGLDLFGLLGILSFMLLILFFQFRVFPLSAMNERAYNRFFLKNALLSDISPDVELAINSTNLETGRLFVFNNTSMGDSKYTYDEELPQINYKASNFPLARAVAASTAVPGVFTPVRIKKKFYNNQEDYKLIKPRLVDGGVYDNQGLHKLTQTSSKYGCYHILVSDAGNEMPFKNKYWNSFALLFRTSNVFMNRIKNLQMAHELFQVGTHQEHEVAYQSLGWNFEESIPEFIKALKKGQIKEHVWKSHDITDADIDTKKWEVIKNKLKISVDYSTIIKELQPDTELKLARNVGTNLVSLTDNQINALISHASIMTEIQLKLYCPSFFVS
ncbi:MAG: patatin-like phospholipase family protein [Maribacter sp.]|uniref:patatin-like phospholipase family protein n=1 Tax=Maribacter sp. TaxID=1897614 RepID=UPI00329A5167